MEVPAPDIHTVAQTLARLIINAAEPVEWGDSEILMWEQAGLRARAGASGFVIRLPMTGQEFVVAVCERLPEPTP